MSDQRDFRPGRRGPRSEGGERGDRGERGERGERGGERGGERSGGRFYAARPRSCQFCADKNVVIDYKNYDLLRRYVHDDGKIRPRRQTGACAKHQRKLAKAIKLARHIALLPFTGEVLR